MSRRNENDAAIEATAPAAEEHTHPNAPDYPGAHDLRAHDLRALDPSDPNPPAPPTPRAPSGSDAGFGSFG